MREQIKDKSRLEHIIEAIDYVVQFTEGVTKEEFSKDIMRRFAVIKNLEIVGEASYMLTNELRERHPEVAWRAIINMRHILVHGYCQINDDIIWETIENDLQPLKRQVMRIIEEESND